MKLQEFFGMYLATTGNSTIAKTNEKIMANWPSDLTEILPSTNNSIDLKLSAFCSTCEKPVPYSDAQGIDKRQRSVT